MLLLVNRKGAKKDLVFPNKNWIQGLRISSTNTLPLTYSELGCELSKVLVHEWQVSYMLLGSVGQNDSYYWPIEKI